MAPSTRTLKLKIILIKKVSSMNFWHPIPHNQMGWPKERIGLSLSQEGQCLTNTRPPIIFGPKLTMTCNTINRLYLHQLLKKTPYELLTGNKPNVSLVMIQTLVPMFFTRGLNLLLWFMNVLCLVMIQTLVPIVFSTRTPIVLKQRVMQCLMKLMALKWSNMILMI
jgi:hypothetical protein